MKKTLAFTAVLSCLSFNAIAQSYIGLSVDNYSGIHGVLYNPASIVDSNFRTDINLASVSVFAGSDYFGIDLGNAFESTEGFNIDDQVQKFPKDDNQFFVNVDVLGPSFMFNLNPKSSLGITTRVRAFMNLNNVNGKLYENIEDGFDETENFDFELRELSGTVHSWAEIGVTYARILMNGGDNFLKGGISLKYLQGAGSNFINAPSVNGEFNAETELITTSGTLTYGKTPGFDSDDVEFSNLSSGFGADLGLIYEYRPNQGLQENMDVVSHSDYKLKLGISVTDIGSISYDGSTVSTYDLNNAVHEDRFEDNDLETVLEEDYLGTEELIDAKISLPTAVHALVDYKFQRHLFLAVQGSLSLVGEGTEKANRILNTVTAVPRFESKWFSFYLPVGMRQYDGFTMGAGLRLGPLSIGSGSLISNYISDSAKTTDVYVGLKIPIYR